MLQRNVDAIRKAGGLALINHPNFGWAFGAAEMLKVDGASFLEIASGHPYVNVQGPPSAEAMWDELLSAGKRIWGVAVDDVHHLRRPWDTDIAPPGKAWVCVRADERKPAAILAALARGDFYASTGVEIDDYIATAKELQVKVREKNGARYEIAFIGEGGRVLQVSRGAKGTYAINRKERYVRAKVTDSNGKTAWLQPVFGRGR